MIYTCTLNPAIDLFIETDELKPSKVNRTNNYDILANGKGVNVSFILKMLGIENQALGIGGGFTNAFIEETLRERGIENHFVHTDQPTRINVFTRVLAEGTEYKEVNAGPQVTPTQVTEFLGLIGKLTATDTLVISGSFSRGVEPQILVKIAQRSQKQGFKLVIDTNYSTVLETLPYKPELLKPNDEELSKWFGLTKRPTLTDLIECGQQLVARGAQNVLLSVGSQGALLVNATTVLLGNAPKGTVVNTACSGDTMLGTFLAGMEQQKPLDENLKYSIAAGSSTAFRPGLTDFTDVDELSKQITIKVIKGGIENG